MADKYRLRFTYPLPDQTYRRLADYLYGPLLFGENSVLLCPPLYGRDHNVRYMRERVWDRRNVLGKKEKSYQFAYIQLTNVEHDVDAFWIDQFLHELCAPGVRDNTFQKLTNALGLIIRDAFDPTFIVNVPESVTDEGLARFLDLAQRTYYINPRRIHFLIVMDMKWNENDFYTLTASYRSLFQNTSHLSLYSDMEVAHFVSYWSQQWHHPISRQARNIIVNQSGGVLLLAKALVRIATKNRLLSVQEIQQAERHPDFLTQVRFFLSRLTPLQQGILNSVANGRRPPDDAEARHLEAMGVLHRDVDILSIRSLALTNILSVRKQPMKKLLEAIKMSRVFTNSQKSVLVELLAHAGHVVSRERISQLLWGDEAEEKYSDWALDQTISRLRKKIAAISALAPMRLVTLKKIGVKLIL